MLSIIHFFYTWSSRWLNINRKIETECNPLVGLLLDNYTALWYNNTRRPVFLRDRISIREFLDLHCNKTRLVAVTTLSCPSFKNQYRNTGQKHFLLQADQQKMASSVYTGLVHPGTLCSTHWIVFFFTFVFLKEYTHFSFKRASNAEAWIGSWII